MDQMTVVGLATDCGKIVPKDLWAHRLFVRITTWKFLQHIFHARIRMASQQGDIICEGTIEGDVIAVSDGAEQDEADAVFGVENTNTFDINID